MQKIYEEYYKNENTRKYKQRQETIKNTKI